LFNVANAIHPSRGTGYINGQHRAQAWMRQTCLDEKPARTGKLPSLSPALLRQLAGMGNNLNQIARQVNGGGGSGHDRVQVVAALMAIDAGLERLRHAVLEKGADDDR
ncbi:MobC family plasmid mobilization relaxosome protein, partial [Streptomyces olivaceoviridis]